MNENTLESIDNRLKLISRLLALDIVKGMQLQEQVKILKDIGMQPTEIADCLDKTVNNVRASLHNIKKKSKKANP